MDTNQRGVAIIQNTKVNSHWYYFIPETTTNSFTITSCFIEQIVMNINSEMVFYIDPEKYEYQHIRVYLDSNSFLEKYEAELYAQQPASPMNLYYDFNSHENVSPLFPTQISFHKQASRTLVSDSEITLPFVVGIYDSSVYFTIHVSKKRYYMLKINQLNHRNSLEIIFTVALVSYVIGYVISILTKIYKLSKADQTFQEMNSRTVSNEVENIQINVENEWGMHSQDREQPETEPYTKSMVSLISTLEKQIKQTEKTQNEQRQNHPQEIESGSKQKNNTEDNKCNICYGAEIIVIFEPCNHRCACAFCALIIIQTSGKCSLCRKKIIEVKTNN